MNDNHYDILKIKDTLIDIAVTLNEIKKLMETQNVPTERESK